MGKNKIKKSTIEKIETGRRGGQIALRGFSYQLIYSCYIVLKFLDNENKNIRFEGIEDVDLYKSTLVKATVVEHIQLKYSESKQDASFFDGILKNYLEAYLADNGNENRYFKLVYDAQIAIGNLSKLVNKKLDKNSKTYWLNKIENIKEEYPNWNWNGFNFDKFCKQLQFENLTKKSLINNIDQLIIKKFEVDTGNEVLFRNSLFYNVFHMAQEREKITFSMLLQMMQDTTDEITKGYQNPAYDWIDKVDFNIIGDKNELQYFEGKKATPSDIVKGLPIRRKALEEEIKQSIIDNQITVIKSSSGQGKTTLAWQVAYDLKDEYSVYKINWCRDSREINNIIKYFNSRLKLGEKLLIVIDNLDEDLLEWNKLSQVLDEKISINYSILVTTREEDWYHLSGDQSNLGRLNIIDIFLDFEEAKQIYINLKSQNKIYESVNNWQSAWERVKDRKVLIEYVYLLTHGEMIEDRISNQLRKIDESKNSKIKYEILRQIALADIIGVKLRTDKLLEKFIEDYPLVDFNEIMMSIEKEYFIKLDKSIGYIEGLHPVRSKYIVDILHKYYPVKNTLTRLLEIIDEVYVSKIYSQIPIYLKVDKDEFYSNLANTDSKKSYKHMVNAIQGVFSGSIFKYYNENKLNFDDANKHAGLRIFINDINPWNDQAFGAGFKVISDLNTKYHENPNTKYLYNLLQKIEKHTIKESDYYIYIYYLFYNLKDKYIKRDKSFFVDLSNWLYRINNKFDIVSNLNFDDIWRERDEWDFNDLSKLMYIFSSISKSKYMKFISKFKDEIFSYLRIKTDSYKLCEKNNRIYVEYILLPYKIKNENDESVNRIEAICRFLPIYDFYCSSAIRPSIDILEDFMLIDDSYKEMPLGNVTLTFNSDLNILWNKSILSQYEFNSIYDWQRYWINIREKVVEFLKLNIEILEKQLKVQNQNKNTLKKLDEIRNYVISSLNYERIFPYEERPFQREITIAKVTNKLKSGYLFHIQNYFRQCLSVIMKQQNDHLCKLAMINLECCKNVLTDMQSSFDEVCNKTVKYFSTETIKTQEELWINRLILLNQYYLNNNPSKMFNRNEVSKWHEKKSSMFMQKISNILSNATQSSKFNFIEPNRVIKDKSLTILPICVENYNLTDEADGTNLIISLINLGEIDIDFLLIIVLDDSKSTSPCGIRINIDLFKELNRLKNKDEEVKEDIDISPFPCEITKEHLECFDIDIMIKESVESQALKDVEIFLLLLWEISKYKGRLNETQGDENKYLLDKIKVAGKELENILDSIREREMFNEIDTLTKLRNDILEKNIHFGDNELNAYLNKWIYEIR